MRRPSPIFFPVLVGAVLLALGGVTATNAQEKCITAGAHPAFPELGADRPYQQPADDSRP
jgi:hypothetical protein